VRGLVAAVVAAALWLVAGGPAADEVGAERAAEFAVADYSAAADAIGGTRTAVLLAATGVAVLVSVLLLLLGGERARRSRALLDRLDSQLEGFDE
jgi:hypothetical protein